MTTGHSVRWLLKTLLDSWCGVEVRMFKTHHTHIIAWRQVSMELPQHLAIKQSIQLHFLCNVSFSELFFHHIFTFTFNLICN